MGPDKGRSKFKGFQQLTSQTLRVWNLYISLGLQRLQVPSKKVFRVGLEDPSPRAHTVYIVHSMELTWKWMAYDGIAPKGGRFVFSISMLAPVSRASNYAYSILHRLLSNRFLSTTPTRWVKMSARSTAQWLGVARGVARCLASYKNEPTPQAQSLLVPRAGPCISKKVTRKHHAEIHSARAPVVPPQKVFGPSKPTPNAFFRWYLGP